ncbi:hypothetical protein B296_00039367 [Ensete ventricosum]|uniref:Uncharacterized protein n=1 Tax=Ensete ventricosum TaxID=4639 RepID=A0A426XET8_ENSVE|nr:hypothetical protein B296_00039367 [Ensete ventricosum]
MSKQATIESYREGAEVHRGADLCKKQSMDLLAELHLPKALLPLAAVEEVGYNRATGFVWLRQKKVHHPCLQGRSERRVLIWVSITDMYIDDPESKRIAFKTPAGIGRSFPVSAAFEADADEEETRDDGGGGAR